MEEDVTNPTTISRVPACAGANAAPPAPTVSTGVGGGNIGHDICTFCGTCAATIASLFADFDCGTSWSELEGWERSMRCRENVKGD